MAKKEGKLIANNKKAYHDYFILEKYEAGIVLHGTEVKSLRMGQCSIKEAFIRIENGEMFIYGMHVSPYEKGNIFNKDPLRPRKLLLHKKEIDKIFGKMKEKVLAASDTSLNTASFNALQADFVSLRDQITKAATNAKFNGASVADSTKARSL